MSVVGIKYYANQKPGFSIAFLAWFVSSWLLDRIEFGKMQIRSFRHFIRIGCALRNLCIYDAICLVSTLVSKIWAFERNIWAAISLFVWFRLFQFDGLHLVDFRWVQVMQMKEGNS